MLIEIQGFKMEIDLEATKKYYETHSLCDCGCCRNFYAQCKTALPSLDSLLKQMGIDICRPDELGSIENGGVIDYLFASYTVCGRIIESGKADIISENGGHTLNVVIGAGFIPNEQKGDYFVVEVDNISLPWVLKEPFPEVIPG